LGFAAATLLGSGCAAGSQFASTSLQSAAAQARAVRGAEPQSTGYAVLYAFAGAPDGANPWGGVSLDQNDDVFGTTHAGGTSSRGTVFELTNTGSGYSESIVHEFGSDGNSPDAAPLEDDLANLYVTYEGGATKGSAGGVVELSPGADGFQETGTFDFKSSRGAAPASPLLEVTSGSFRSKRQLGYISTLYTPASKGGKYGFGSLASFSLSLSYTDLYNFRGPAKGDGAYPTGAVAIDPEDPTLGVYGSTTGGGSANAGTVFQYEPTTKTETVLYSFKGGAADGAAPVSGVIVDTSGNIYGTTQTGGPNNAGVLFKLTKGTSGFTESVLHAFGAGGDGAAPLAAPSLSAKGNELYGTTSAGGANGVGTIYAIGIGGAGYKVLHSFSAPSGSTPGTGSLAVSPTALYGTTESGGAGSAGVVFSFTL